VDETFTLAGPPAAPVTIPAGTVIRTPSVTTPIAFQLLADLVIPMGAAPPVGVGTIEHSTSHADLFAATGLPNQQVALGSTPYLDDSAVVTAANGAFTQVQNFLSSTATDRHFTVVVDQNDRATLRFGNGVGGALPAGTITVAYKIGGGAAGNVDARTLTKLDGSFTDDHGTPVQLAVTNPTRADGGMDRQTIAQIQTLAPESIRVLNRTVAREDFEINARRISSVARALMLTSNEDKGIAENSGILFVIPAGGGVPSQVLKTQVLQQVTVAYPCTLTFQVAVQDPSYLPIAVQATVFLRQGADAGAVRAGIVAALGGFFAVTLADGTPNPTVDFGFNVKDADGNPAGSIALSDLFDLVASGAGVRKLGAKHGDFALNGAHADVALDLREFPTLGQITLVNGDTGQPL
jgi:predicted phage baseplate assembly protein